MKITDVNQLPLYFKVGDRIWGCSYGFKKQDGGELTLRQKPILGILSHCRYEKDYMDTKHTGANYISYFIPLKRDNKTPSWKKAIPAYLLHYASTEEECSELYNEAVLTTIEVYKEEIKRLRKDIIKIKPFV